MDCIASATVTCAPSPDAHAFAQVHPIVGPIVVCLIVLIMAGAPVIMLARGRAE